jgi:hypothetical protein
MTGWIRVWWDTRWFMKYWEVGRPYARFLAQQRERTRLRRKEGYR